MVIYNSFTVLVDNDIVKVEELEGDEFLLSINDFVEDQKGEHAVFPKIDLIEFANKLIKIAESRDE